MLKGIQLPLPLPPEFWVTKTKEEREREKALDELTATLSKLQGRMEELEEHATQENSH